MPATTSSPSEVVRAITSSSYPAPQGSCARHDDRAVTFSDVVTRLERELRRELPGAEAQARLAPIPRRDWPAGFNPARIRHAAGLLLVFPKHDDRTQSSQSPQRRLA